MALSINLRRAINRGRPQPDPSQYASAASLYSSLLSAQSAAAAASTAIASSTTSDVLTTTAASSALSGSTTLQTQPIIVSSAGTITDGTAGGQTTSTDTASSISDGSLVPVATTSTPVLASSTFSTIPTSTLQTSASTSIPSQPAQHTPDLLSSSTAGATATPIAGGDGTTFYHRHHHGNMAGGLIAAAVIVPLIAILLLLCLLLLLLRQRRHRQGQDFRPVAEMKQKFQRQFSPTSAQPHINTSPNNATYFTGLETESLHDGATPGLNDEAAPPPYTNRGNSQIPEADRMTSAPMLHINDMGPSSLFPVVAAAPPAHSHTRNVSDASTLAPLASPVMRKGLARNSTNNLPRPNMSRQQSARSITSTLYSSDASVMEAEPAQMSLAEPHVVRTPSHGMDKSPFADPS